MMLNSWVPTITGGPVPLQLSWESSRPLRWSVEGLGPVDPCDLEIYCTRTVSGEIDPIHYELSNLSVNPLSVISVALFADCSLSSNCIRIEEQAIH